MRIHLTFISSDSKVINFIVSDPANSFLNVVRIVHKTLVTRIYTIEAKLVDTRTAIWWQVKKHPSKINRCKNNTHTYTQKHMRQVYTFVVPLITFKMRAFCILYTNSFALNCSWFHLMFLLLGIAINVIIKSVVGLRFASVRMFLQ